MFDAILTFFNSILIFLASIMPGNSVGLAIIILAIIIYLILYFVRKIHVKNRVYHELISHDISKLKWKTDKRMQEVYENFMYFPWKGIWSTILYGLIFFFFFYIVHIISSTSPTDIRHLYFNLVLVPHNLDYSFLGQSVLSYSYSEWFTFLFSFFLFITMFLHTARRWKYDKKYNLKHLVELVIIVFITLLFTQILKHFTFGAMLYWLTYILISLVFEVITYHKFVKKINAYKSQLSVMTQEIKGRAFWDIQNVFNKVFIRMFAKGINLKEHEAASRFHEKNQSVHHLHLIEAIRHQLIGDPYVVIVILMAIFLPFM